MDLKKLLTRTEYSILELLADGKSNKEIADALFRAEKTIAYHIMNIYCKLGVENPQRVNAALIYLKEVNNEIHN